MIDLILAVLQTQKYITISDLNPQWSKLCFDNYTLELKSYILDQSLVLKEGFYFSLHTSKLNLQKLPKVRAENA